MSSMLKQGKFLAYVLRHHPETLDIIMDGFGYVDTYALVTSAKRRGIDLDIDTIVEHDSKQRFRFDETRKKICASYGHSVPILVSTDTVIPPDVLFHGTSYRFIDAIRLSRLLLPMSRTHVMLTTDRALALTIGARHGEPLVLTINARECHENTGTLFYNPTHSMWMAKQIDWCFVETTLTQHEITL